MRKWLPVMAGIVASLCAGVSAYFFSKGRYVTGLEGAVAFALWYLVFVLAVYRGRRRVLEIVIVVRPHIEEETQDEQDS